MSSDNICQWCGSSIEPGAKECGACGQPVEKVTSQLEDTEKIEEVSAESWSGFEELPVSEPEPTSTDRWGSPLPIEEPDSPSRWGSPQEDSIPQVESYQPASTGNIPQEKPKKKFNWWLVAILAVMAMCACVVVAGIGIYNYM